VSQLADDGESGRSARGPLLRFAGDSFMVGAPWVPPTARRTPPGSSPSS